MRGQCIGFFNDCIFIADDAEQAYRIAGHCFSGTEYIIEKNVSFHDFFFKMVIVIAVRQQLRQLNVMRGCKTEDAGAAEASQDLGGGGDPFHGVGAPQDLVHKTEDRLPE